jgi:hypothetical protein
MKNEKGERRKEKCHPEAAKLMSVSGKRNA